MSHSEKWKSRLLDMQGAVDKILKYTEGLRSAKDLASDGRTLDASIRNFQILGEAAKKIPSSIQKELSGIPWRQIKGMRNVLVHEYFGTSEKMIWKTIDKDLRKLSEILKTHVERLDRPIHDWKICPPGETYVRRAKVDAHLRRGQPVNAHLRRDHCRESSASSKNILSVSEIQDIVDLNFASLAGGPAPHDLGFGSKGNEFDSLIRGWVRYWNETLKPSDPLDANLVKALIASESSFQVNSNRKRRGAAKGLMQLLPTTIRYLRGEGGELKDHIFEFDDKDIFDAHVNISAGIRWLFRKRETATARLGRLASWDEAAEEYKDYLRRRLKNPKEQQKGMEVFRRYLRELRSHDSSK